MRLAISTPSSRRWYGLAASARTRCACVVRLVRVHDHGGRQVLAIGCQYGALDREIPGLSAEYVAVPVLSIPAGDFALRQDAVLLLRQLALSADDLVFLPALAPATLSRLVDASRLKVMLTDHNALSAPLDFLAPAVVGVVDHHEDTGAFASAAYYQVDPTCGSACTLVAHLLQNGAPALLSAEVQQLLSAPILLDTEALKGPKTSALDRQLAADFGLLREGTAEPTAAAEAQHQALLDQRVSVGALTSAQRLRKDYKQWTHASLTYGIATVPCSLRAWTDALADIEDALAEVPPTAPPLCPPAFPARLSCDESRRKQPPAPAGCHTDASTQAAEANGLGLLLVMLTSKDEDSGQFQRQLLVYSADPAQMQQCAAFLAASSFPAFESLGVPPSLALDSAAIAAAAPRWHGRRALAFQQGNVKASRKQLQPAVEAFCRQLLGGR